MAWNLVDSREESNPCKNKILDSHLLMIYHSIKKTKLFYEWRKVYFSTIYNVHCRGINREMKLAFGLRNRQTFYTVGVLALK